MSRALSAPFVSLPALQAAILAAVVVSGGLAAALASRHGDDARTVAPSPAPVAMASRPVDLTPFMEQVALAHVAPLRPETELTVATGAGSVRTPATAAQIAVGLRPTSATAWRAMTPKVRNAQVPAAPMPPRRVAVETIVAATAPASALPVVVAKAESKGFWRVPEVKDVLAVVPSGADVVETLAQTRDRVGALLGMR